MPTVKTPKKKLPPPPRATKPTKTWFPVGKGDHERTITQQMTGLRPLLDEIRTAKLRGQPLSVLDVACAEGLIGMELAKAGASYVHGFELVPERVEDARRLSNGLSCSWEVADVNDYQPERTFDVVACLSILHKLPDPSTTLRRLVGSSCLRMVVIRLPPQMIGGLVMDRRSGHQPHDLDKVLRSLRFNLEEETEGPLGEWTGYWRLKS